MKGILILLSILFLVGGGACSLALLAAGGVVLGLPMLGLCVFTFVVVNKWAKSNSDTDDILRKKSILWVSLTAVVVIGAYIVTFIALSHVGTQ
jgi:hypothetical protein